MGKGWEIGNSGVGKVYLSKDIKDVGTELCGHMRVRQREEQMQMPGGGNVLCMLRGSETSGSTHRFALDLSAHPPTRLRPELSCFARPPAPPTITRALTLAHELDRPGFPTHHPGAGCCLRPDRVTSGSWQTL